MQTVTEEKKMITVTSRQINAAANKIKTEEYLVLSKDWAKQAVDVACNHGGSIDIEADSVMAGIIRRGL